MRHVPIAEFKDKLSEIVAAVEAGEEFVITRHGRDIAKLGATDDAQHVRRKAALDGLAQLRAEFAAKGVSVSAAEWVAWKNEGRR